MLKLVVVDTLNRTHISIGIKDVEESRSWFKEEQLLIPIPEKVVGLGDEMQTYIVNSISLNLAHIVSMQWFHSN